MIKYALICSDCDAEFEAWFASSDAYDNQAERGLIECIECHGNKVGKAIMGYTNVPVIVRPKTG